MARRAFDSDRFSSQATGMGCRGASAPGIVAPGAWVSARGCSFAFDANRPPGSRRCRRWPDRPRGRGRAPPWPSAGLCRGGDWAYEQSRIGAGELVRRLGKFAELRGLWPVVGSHAMARTHMISNQHTSPIALAKRFKPSLASYARRYMLGHPCIW